MSASPSPVSRACLGCGVTVGEVADVEARGLGIIRIHGEWPEDEIAVADGYPDDQVASSASFAAHLLESPDPIIVEHPEDQPGPGPGFRFQAPSNALAIDELAFVLHLERHPVALEELAAGCPSGIRSRHTTVPSSRSVARLARDGAAALVLSCMAIQALSATRPGVRSAPPGAARP